jgi:hypothetical protein
VQAWLATPATDDSSSFPVTQKDIQPLYDVYHRGNDDVQAWLATIAKLRGRGFRPLASPKLFGGLAGLMNHSCDLITQNGSNSQSSCKATLPETLPKP